VAAFKEMKTQMTVTSDARARRYVECVARAITAQVDAPNAPSSWEVVVFEEESANAFALPGGKIGVHTGLLDVATNQHQLATVLGHEVAHVLAEHGNERVSTQLATQGGLELIQAISGPASPTKNAALAALGLGAQVGVLLPFSRAQESEADTIGLELMARAGFDPRQGPVLWENMSRQGGQPPEFLSTHPSGDTRIRSLEAQVPEVMPVYERARSAGRRPSCS
jgi:predicted Zn-dependent protease